MPAASSAPRSRPLAAVEVVDPKMPCTVDADELRKMNAEGKITGCVVDGPLSMDIAIDPEAAHHKGAQDRPAAGHADILLFPDIQAAAPCLQDAGPHCRLQERLHPDRYQGPRYPDEPAPIPSRRRSTPSHWPLWSQRGCGSVIVKSLPHRGKVAELSEAG